MSRTALYICSALLLGLIPARSADQAEVKVGKLWVSPSVSNYGYVGNCEYPGGSLDYYIIEYSAVLAFRAGGDQVVLFGGALGRSELDYGFSRADGLKQPWEQSADGRSVSILSATADLSQLADPNPQSVAHTTIIQAYAHEDYDDFMLLTHTFRNTGTDTLTDFYFGYHLPADVGASGVSTPELDDWTARDPGTGLTYMYDDDGDNELTPYFVGNALLDAPDLAGGTNRDQDWTNFTYYLMTNPIIDGTDLLARMTGGLWDNSASPGPYSVISTVGPYTLEPGGTITFTVALVYGDGFAGLQENYANARKLKTAGWRIPASETPPAVPLLDTPKISGRLVQLDWDFAAESAADFYQYRVYRSTVSAVGPWELLDTVITNTIIDLNVRVGFPYFYAVNSEDLDGNRSGLWGAACRTLNPVRPLNDPSSKTSGVRVVPNPYLGGANWELEDYENSIFFTHLPEVCTVTIYSVTGEEIISLAHNQSDDPTFDGSGDERWDLVSKNGQTAASGLYLYLVNTPDGNRASGQFVIVKGSR